MLQRCKNEMFFQISIATLGHKSKKQKNDLTVSCCHCTCQTVIKNSVDARCGGVELIWKLILREWWYPHAPRVRCYSSGLAPRNVMLFVVSSTTKSSLQIWQLIFHH